MDNGNGASGNAAGITSCGALAGAFAGAPGCAQGQVANSGDLPSGQEDSLKTTLYRTLRFQGFIREFVDQDVRSAFLEGHFGVEENTHEMLSCFDKILELVMPSLRWEDDPWDAKSRTGVSFITDMLDGSEGEPTDRFGCALPIRKTFNQWLQYFGHLRKSVYWKTFRKSYGAGGGARDVRMLSAGFPVSGKLSMQDGGERPLPLRQSSPVRTSHYEMRKIHQVGVTSGTDEHSNLGDFTGELFLGRQELQEPYQGGNRQSAPQKHPSPFVGKSHNKVAPADLCPGKAPSNESTDGRVSRPHVVKGVRASFGESRRVSGYRGKAEVPRTTFAQAPHTGQRLGSPPHSPEQEGEGHGTSHRRRASKRPRTFYRSRSCKRSQRHCEDDSSLVSTSSSSEFEGASSDSGERREFPRHPQEESIVDLFRGMKLSRDVVAPRKFTGQGGASLKGFLTDYEKYFSEKYSGTDRQCSQLLGEFLAGSAKDAYEALGGNSSKYSKLKLQLLDWYKSERTSQRRICEEDFDGAVLGDKESLTIYALRLEHMATKAFPHRRERERQLCRKFWQSVPQNFGRVLASSEHSLALMDGKKMGWRDMKRLAEVEDRQARRATEGHRREVVTGPSVWFSRPAEYHVSLHDEQNKLHVEEDFYRRRPKSVCFERGPRPAGLSPPRGGPSRRTESSGDRPRSMSRSRQRSRCNWCGRGGHFEDSCWEKKGFCMLCGSEKHNKEGCLKFDSGWRNFTPVCSVCKGDHLGRDCPNHPLK